MAKGRKPIPKTQRELSESLQTPYEPPVGSPGFSPTGNPNDADRPNRAEQFSFKNDPVKPLAISLEDLDWAIMYYFQDVIRPSVFQNGERIPVPIIYGSPEKWKSFQKDGYYRDLQGKIMAPLIMFKRNTITKDRSLNNKLDANNPHNVSIQSKKYSPKNTYDNFSVLNNIRPEKVNYAVIVPDYLTLTYSCAVNTYYMDQLNKIIEAIEYASDAYWGDPARFQFRAMIDSFTTTNTLSDNAERVVSSTFSIKMNGYIIPDVLQKDLTALKKLSDKTKIIVNERVFGDNVQDTYYNILNILVSGFWNDQGVWDDGYWQDQ